MINLTRLDNTQLVINSDLIEFVEAIPETMICLTTGKKIMVRESVDTVVEKVAAFKRRATGSILDREKEELAEDGGNND